MNALQTLDRNQAAAATFVTKLSNLNPQWYGQIQAPDVDAEPYASARVQVDSFRTLAGKGPSTQMGEFIVTSDEQLSQASLPPAVEDLARCVVSAILVRNLDEQEQALRTLYQPFEDFIPIASIASRP